MRVGVKLALAQLIKASEFLPENVQEESEVKSERSEP
jgi:hypothetical protein